MTLLISVENSIQEPLKGMIRAEYNVVPLVWTLEPKNTPGERCNCDTTTRSAPFMTKVPCGVIYGISPRYTSLVFVSKSSCSASVHESLSLAFNLTQ